MRAKNQDALVTVKLVVNYNISFGGQEQQKESKTEAMGTVIDPSGLTVISLTTIDPSALMKAQMRGGQRDMKIDSEVKDAKIVLADNTEIPAQVVLRDKDLDVAYLRRPTSRPNRSLPSILPRPVNRNCSTKSSPSTASAKSPIGSSRFPSNASMRWWNARGRSTCSPRAAPWDWLRSSR